ncbi:tetratricopeptide repeat protein [Bacteroidota bacterium]
MAEKDYILHQKIEDFLNGNLQGEELSSFKKLIKDDAELAARLKIHEQIIKGIIMSEEDKIQSIMDKADRDLDSTSPGITKSRKIFMFAAAAIILLLIGTYFVFFHQSKSQQLFNEYFTVLPNQISLSRSVEIPQEFSHFSSMEYDQIIDAMTSYNKGEYNKTCDILNELPLSESKDHELVLYQAISQLNEGKTTDAIQNLKSLVDKSDYKFQADVSWYLALAYLQNNEVEIAIQILRTLTKSRNQHSEEAMELLVKLN